MKNLLFAFTLLSASLFIGCSPKITLPKGLNKGLLLVEKFPVDSVIRDENGKKKVVEKKVGGWTSMYNRAWNKKIEKVFATYPYDYKIVTEEEVGDYIDPKRATYFLKNGKKTTKITHNMSSSGPAVKMETKFDVIVENLSAGRKSKLCTIKNGLAGIAPKFVKMAKKQSKSSSKGKKKK
jgi:hypothetical protein